MVLTNFSTHASAKRAVLRLELEGKNFQDAFKPQLQFVHNTRVFAARQLQGDYNGSMKDILKFNHIVFRKVRKQ